VRQRAPRRSALRNDERINVGLPAEVHAALVAESQAENVTLTVIVRRAIEYYQTHAPRAVAPARRAS
jgi:hypothetical protein